MEEISFWRIEWLELVSFWSLAFITYDYYLMYMIKSLLKAVLVKLILELGAKWELLSPLFVNFLPNISEIVFKGVLEGFSLVQKSLIVER